jgi:hypothetical protein
MAASSSVLKRRATISQAIALLWALACAPASSANAIGSGDGGVDSGRPSSAPPANPSDRLSGSGLYAQNGPAQGPAPGVLEYAPRFGQWLDGAALRHFLWLPPGAVIDTSDADDWSYPSGTRAWQELARDGVKIETRFMEKLGPDDWRFMTYHWETDDDAIAVESGLTNADGSGHDIPHLVDCGSCHDNVSDRLLGVSSIQIADSLLDQLTRAGRLSSAPAAGMELPGDATTRAALGYLHSNCGSCHNPRSIEYRSVDLELWLPVAALGSVEDTPVYRTAVDVPRRGLGAASALPALRVAPGSPSDSALYQRMASRDALVQMPPLGTKLVDTVAIENVAAWISGLGPR